MFVIQNRLFDLIKSWEVTKTAGKTTSWRSLDYHELTIRTTIDAGPGVHRWKTG